MLKGFKDFILRGNVVELAVAVVVGAAFTAIVNTVVSSLINPLIGLFFDADSLDAALVVEVPTIVGDGTSTFAFGAVLGAVINFLVVAAVIYFVLIVPMNRLNERLDDDDDELAEEPAETSEQILAEIRDLLAAKE